jgi:hypothetical protein
VATPARLSINLVVQDDRGFKARVRFVTFDPDVSANGNLISGEFSAVAALGAAVQAFTNAKVVSTGFGWDFDLAQEPTSETGTYQLVQDKAILTFGDGSTLKNHVFIPAPVDAAFETTTQDNLIVIKPGASVVTGLQSAMSAFNTPSGGVYGSQFFGGQYVGRKPRRRRVLQGA